MLIDEEADDIRRQLESGIRGPILLRWIRALLDDRDERVGRRVRDRAGGSRRC
jgi:hypothetical protein